MRRAFCSLLLSASVFNNSGPGVLYFPEFDAPETNYGRALKMDGEKGFHLFGMRYYAQRV